MSKQDELKTQGIAQLLKVRETELALLEGIARAVGEKWEMQAVYDFVGQYLSQLFDTQNILIAAYDPETGLGSFPFMLEEGQRVCPSPRPMTEFVFGKKLLDDPRPIKLDTVEQFAELGLKTIDDTKPSLSGIFVPMVSGDKVYGGFSIQNLEKEYAFSDADVKLLVTIANSISQALENARLFEETQKRNAELAVINSVQQGLVAQMEMPAIYNLVGDTVREIFEAQVIMIGLYDHDSRMVTIPYGYEKGKRFKLEANYPFNILTDHLIDKRDTVLINENALDYVDQYEMFILAGEQPLSMLFVPLVLGYQVNGFISLQNIDREKAFSHSDVRLLETLAASMSVALENARLFDETQRLLEETRQRNAELELLNSVQQGLVAELDMQAIYDLVGDKVREIFHAQVVLIAIYNQLENTTSVPYLYEKGERFFIPDSKSSGLCKHFQGEPRTLLINENIEEAYKEYDLKVRIGEAPKSLLFVPLVVGKEVTGHISLQCIDRENAFSDSDVRLLETLAASMSVALQNAGLLAETQHLLEETQQRNTELAIINSVQQGLVAQVDIDAIYDLVGAQIRDTFEAQAVTIEIYDFEAQSVSLPYIFEKGQRHYTAPYPLQPIHHHLTQERHALLINENLTNELAKNFGYKTEHIAAIPGTEVPLSAVFVPLIVGDAVIGNVTLQNVDKEQAFSQADVRLLETLAASMSVALENARLFEEIQRRNAELAVINSVQHGLVAQIDMMAIYELVGDQIRDIFDAQVVTVNHFDHEKRLNDYCYVYEKGQRFQIQSQPFTPVLEEFIASGDPMLINRGAGEKLGEGGGRVVIGDIPKSFLAVPLWSDKKVSGSISLQNVDRENAFNNNNLRLLSTVAASTSVALDNARLFAMIKRRAKEMAALAEVGRDISATLDLPTVLERIAYHARELLNVKDSAVFLPDESGALMKGYVALGPIAAQVKASTIQPGVGILGEIWNGRQAEVINAAQNDPRAVLIAGTEQQEDEKMMVTPLFSGERVTGLMAVWRTGGDNFNEADLEFFVGLSRQAGIAIENARLYSEVETARATAEEANRSKSAFLANVSHELRTPLTSILGFAHVLQNRIERRILPVVPAEDQSAQQALAQIDESLAIILSEGERLTALINNVLDLEKIEAGKMDWDMQTLDLAQVLEQGIDATSSMIEQKGLELKREIANPLPLIIGDHDRLVQVIINLLSNAIKFTNNGIITCRAQEQDEVVLVSISDTGEGIAEVDLESVFDLFQQVGDTLTEKPRGTGLGLPICREIIERHGGRIWVESELKQGSTFSFLLPVGSVADPGAQHNRIDDQRAESKQQIGEY